MTTRPGDALATSTGRDRRVDTSVPVVVLAPGYVGHGIARSLGRLGVAVFGVHGDRRSPSARSRFWRENFVWNMAGTAPQASLDWLLGLGRRIGSRPILIPTDDGSCLFVADHASVLREEFRFPAQPAGLARSLSSKRGMYHVCKELGVPTAETVFPRSRDDVVEFARGAGFPVMLKPIENLAAQRRRADMRMVIVDDADALLSLYDRMETPDAPNLMLQEYLPGGPEMVWMFNGYFDAESSCLFGLTGRKLRQYPAYTGVTSLGVCVANDAVAERTREFMKSVRYRGILDIGYKYDVRTREYKLLDVNPRIGATFRLFVDSAGMDVVRAMYLDLTGQRVTPGRPLEGRRWVVENFDPVSSLRYVRDGRLTPREWARSFRGVQEGAWFARDDLGPFAAVAWRSMGMAVGRLFGNDGLRSPAG